MGSEIADLLQNYRDLSELKIRVEGIVLERDSLRAQLAEANERAQKAEAEQADALRCSGENAKAWQEAVCDEAVKRTHLLKEIGLTEQQRDALRAQLAEATERIETYKRDRAGWRVELDSSTAACEELRARAEKAEHLLEVSEDYRRAYQDGKYKMYASDDEDVREAAAKYLPCNEGPLERAVDAVSGSAQLKRLNCALAARVAELEAQLAEARKEAANLIRQTTPMPISLDPYERGKFDGRMYAVEQLEG